MLLKRATGIGAWLVQIFGVTVNTATLEVMPFNEALIVVLPAVRAEALPLEFSVATAVLLEAHTTEPEILPVVLSE